MAFFSPFPWTSVENIFSIGNYNSSAIYLFWKYSNLSDIDLSIFLLRTLTASAELEQNIESIFTCDDIIYELRIILHYGSSLENSWLIKVEITDRFCLGYTSLFLCPKNQMLPSIYGGVSNNIWLEFFCGALVLHVCNIK